MFWSEEGRGEQSKMKRESGEADANEWAKQTLERGMDKLMKEYATICEEVPAGLTTKAFARNPNKNRYPGELSNQRRW